MTPIQAQHMLTLAAYLREKVADEHFNMMWYLAHYGDSDEAVDYAEAKTAAAAMEKHLCGTAACALGYATNIWPDVFQLEMWETGQTAGLRIFGKRGGLDGEAVQEWFGIDSADCMLLFNQHEGRTRLEEAELIEAVVRQYGYEIPLTSKE